jgi:murein DD-endopeptidase MepM/ murein hydrolase activator NlpD
MPKRALLVAAGVAALGCKARPLASSRVEGGPASGAADVDMDMDTGSSTPDAVVASDANVSPGGFRGGVQTTHVEVAGSLVATLVAAVPVDGSVVAAQVARLFMWDLNLRQDVLRGDRIDVVWQRDQAGEIVIAAARYTAASGLRALSAYRFRTTGDEHASYWDPAGQELPRRLTSSPLDRYEQITALVKDRAAHKGMDFKTAVGTPVRAPRAGVVTRADWKQRGNGRCLEVRHNDGVLAKFLHLSDIRVRPGSRVRQGDVIALTGNTGRSTAPHLHYQLNRAKVTVDPIQYHGTWRRRLDKRDLAAFRAVKKQMAHLIEPAQP